ncbi:hypothetical protein HDC90_002522 [Pedobacter sp. AK013]|nr:hypothetical protein [Pedobacter sp. AK013]
MDRYSSPRSGDGNSFIKGKGYPSRVAFANNKTNIR